MCMYDRFILPLSCQGNLFNTKVKMKVLVAQSCPTLCDHMYCSPPGSSVYSILQARILEWLAISSSNLIPAIVYIGFPGGLAVKNLPANAGDMGSTPQEDPLGGGNGNPLQYSYLGNPMDRGAWRDTVHVVTKESGTTERPSTHTRSKLSFK